MNRTRGKQIIENLSLIRKDFDELTRSILEYCLENKETKSYSNLVTFVTSLNNTENIKERFKIIDVSQIIDIDDVRNFQDFLIENSYLKLLGTMFDKVKYLIKCCDGDHRWYELDEKPPQHVDTGRTVLYGEIGRIKDVYKFSCGALIDIISDLQKKIKENKDRIEKITIENKKKKYYVVKL